MTYPNKTKRITYRKIQWSKILKKQDNDTGVFSDFPPDHYEPIIPDHYHILSVGSHRFLTERLGQDEYQCVGFEMIVS
jgi:hypothetical protein